MLKAGQEKYENKRQKKKRKPSSQREFELPNVDFVIKGCLTAASFLWRTAEPWARARQTRAKQATTAAFMVTLTAVGLRLI